MCECGCGSRPFDEVLKLQDGSALAYRLYDGCNDCYEGIGVDLGFFDKSTNEFLDGITARRAPKPDEYGGNRGAGVSFPIVELSDLRAIADELTESDPVDGYATLSDWLEEHGMELLQRAIRRRKTMKKAKKR